MANTIQYTGTFVSKFIIAKCVNVPAGDYYIIPAVPDDTPYVEGSDSVVATLEMLLVTSGSFDFEIEGQDTVHLTAGEMAPAVRYKSAHRVVAAENGSGYVCLRPRTDVVWARQAGSVVAGDAIDVETPDATMAYVYIVSGAVNDYVSGDLFPVTPNETTTLRATAHTRFIHLWV